MLFLQRRDIASAILLSTPAINSSLKTESLNAMHHRAISGLGASLMNNKFDGPF